MAFKLSQPLRSQLNVNDQIDNQRTNPQNLDSIQLPSGLVISRDYTQFDRASADKRIDELTEQREKYVQGKRVADEETKTLKAYAQLMSSIEKLATACYETEQAAARAEVKIRTLSHQLVVLKKKLASEHAAKVEETYIGFIDFERSLSQRLHDLTDTSRGGGGSSSFGGNGGTGRSKGGKGKGGRHLAAVA